jgi:hypothetical protein
MNHSFARFAVEKPFNPVNFRRYVAGCLLAFQMQQNDLPVQRLQPVNSFE